MIGQGAGPVAAYLDALAADLRPLRDGKPATYIPELGKADPDLFGIAIATVDGQIYAAGDAGHRFTIQSISKPFSYGHALDRLGRDAVLDHVGVEPTGESFNSILLDTAHNRPFNPMVNAGAIAVAELIEGEDDVAQRAALDELMARFAGRPLALDEAVYLSEKATGHRNRAIAWMMLNSGMIRGEPEAVLDLYFRQCSLLVDCRDLALMGATLANDGVNPATGERALKRVHVPDVLTVMNMCGMYNYAGQWSYEIGLPAKSGVSGGILLVIPGQAGIAIFSPPLDENGNSVRGIAACARIADDFGLHIFGTHPNVRSAIRLDYRGDRVRSKRARGPAERALLDRAARRVHIIEAQDALFFGSAERLLRRATALAEGADWLVIDLRRVWSADMAAARLLAGFADDMAAAGKRLVLANLDPTGPLAEIAEAVSGRCAAMFDSRDAALEHVEEALIAEQAPDLRDAAADFDALDIVAGLDADQVARVRALAIPLRFAEGEYLAHEGEEAPLFFAIATGRASIRLPVGDGRHVRIGSVGPGMTCGEMALVDRGRRSADIVADDAVSAWGFGIEELHALGQDDPALLIAMIGNITRDLAARLRIANAEIRALEA